MRRPSDTEDPDRWLSLPRAEWLALHAELFDAETIRRLERLGVAPGAHALEVGAGSGSIARWLAGRVGPTGRVTATDVDTRFLTAREPNLEVLRHDAAGDELPEGAFDLVHCRAVLVHLPLRERALERMVAALKPGGLLVAEEPWIDAGRLAPEPVVARAVADLGSVAPHIDGAFARRMPLRLRELGLEGVQAEGRLEFFEGGSRRAAYYSVLIERYCSRLVESGELDAADLRRARRRFEDPAWCDCAWPRVAAWGRRPATPHSWRQRLTAGRRRLSARSTGER